ncbi:ArsR/SmtB family transcription factor [Marinicella rhabdoformis]|uniref:ArsR/SmtB family transcription factor n=1 Tax=Marinicella rhabdoformis TaxID=2580566 RepID=UPI0012AEBD3E|nr:metalloregulator ArsR/SmtB family transcription factor [Marinicella rhabdoformis]
MNLNQLFKTLSDESRIRLILLLNQQELSVAELSEITHLAQPRVSTHLSHLRKNKLVIVRKQGVSAYYRFNADLLNAEYGDFLNMIKNHYQDNPLIEEDNQRLNEVMNAHAQSNKWVDAVAGDMERHYSPGRTWEATTRVVAKLAKLGAVLDIGSGDGVLAELMSQQCEHYTCADNNAKAIEAARNRLHSAQNVSFTTCDMHHLPFENNQFDCVMLLHVLTYSKEPELAIKEALRVLKPGGKLLISTLFKHKHQEVKEVYGHVNLGFETQELVHLCEAAGGQYCTASITSQEQKTPNFKIITASASK